MFWRNDIPAVRRPRILVADPNGDYSGDLAAFLSGRFDVIEDPSGVGRDGEFKYECDLAIVAGGLAACLSAARSSYPVQIIILGTAAAPGEEGDLPGLIRLERYPSPIRIASALKSALAT